MSRSEKNFLANCISKIVKNGNKIQIPITGKSMEPTLSDSQIVLLIPVEVNNIKISDIIAYRKFEHITIHRVIKIIWDNNNIIFQTKGDNNLMKDSYKVFAEEIIGKIKKL